MSREDTCQVSTLVYLPRNRVTAFAGLIAGIAGTFLFLAFTPIGRPLASVVAGAFVIIGIGLLCYNFSFFNFHSYNLTRTQVTFNVIAGLALLVFAFAL